MKKIDLKKDYRHLYRPSGKTFSIVEVPSLNFFMIDGRGDPNSAPAYREAVETLYAMSYACRFALKAQGTEFVVMPLEGLWWHQDMARFSDQRKDEWDWTMMIVQPEAVTVDLATAVQEQVARKKNPPALKKLRFEAYEEGLSIQILYTGPYADEHPTIQAMHDYAHELGYVLRSKHHEIYLGDPRRTAPEKLKTVIRQPITKKGMSEISR